MDTDMTAFFEGQGDTCSFRIEINPPLRQIIIAGRTGLLAVDFARQENVVPRPGRSDHRLSAPTAEQNLAAMFSKSVVVGNFVLSPDGTKKSDMAESLIVGSTPGKQPGTVVDLWAYRPMILDAKTGKVLAHNEDDPGSRERRLVDHLAFRILPIRSCNSRIGLADPPFRRQAIVRLSSCRRARDCPASRYLHRCGVRFQGDRPQSGITVWSTSRRKLFPEAAGCL